MRMLAPLMAAAALAGCTVTTTNHYSGPVSEAPEATPAPGNDADAPPEMQWLYGSGEAAASSIQAWRQLAEFAIARSRERKARMSVPMGLGDFFFSPDDPKSALAATS